MAVRRGHLLVFSALQTLLHTSVAKEIPVVWTPEEVNAIQRIDASVEDRLVRVHNLDMHQHALALMRIM